MSEAKTIEEVEFGIPRKGGKDGLLWDFYASRQQLGRIIATLDGMTDPRPELHTRLMISGITDDDIREDVFARLDDEIAEIDESLTERERGKEIIKACMRVQGDITAHYDEFLAVTHKNVIGKV